MTRTLIALGCAAALFILAPFAAAQDASVPAEGLDWHPFEKAVELAKKNDKKLIIDVYAQWCPWCRRLQREVYTDEAVQAYLKENFVLTRLDAENRDETLRFKEYELSPAELSTGLGAEGFPTTVFLDSDGEYITRLPGFLQAGEFLHVLGYVGSEAFVEQTFQEYSDAKGK